MVFTYFHDDPLACHPGADETLRAIRENRFWPRMREDIRRAVGNCAICLSIKSGKPISKGNEHPRQPIAPWDTVAIDLMGSYPRTSRGKRFILVATNVMSRWVEVFAVSNSEIRTIAPILQHEVFMRWGYPRVILSDNAPQFRGVSWQNQCKSCGALLDTTPAYHPQANPTERRNQKLKKGLRLKIAGGRQCDWDLHLPEIVFSLRRRKNRVTGQSPSQMFLGRHLPRPGEWNFNYGKETQDRVDLARQRQAALAASGTSNEGERLRVRELVLARNFALSNAAEGFNAQLAPRWTGPFAVVEECGQNVYILERPGRENIKLHISALKRVPQQEPSAKAVDAAQQLTEGVPDDAPETQLRTQQSITDSRAASTTLSTRAQSPPAAAASATSPTRARASLESASTSPSTAYVSGETLGDGQQASPRLKTNHSDFAAALPPQRRRGRPTKGELARRAVERSYPASRHRYNLRRR